MHAHTRSSRGDRLVRLVPTRRAWAHSTSECYVFFKLRNTALRGTLQLPIGMVADALEVELGPKATVQDLEAHRGEIESLAIRAFTLSEQDVQMDLRFDELRTVDTGAGRFCVLEYTAPTKPLPRTITLSIDGLLEIDHHVATVAVIRTDEGWGRFGHRLRDQLRLDHHHPSRDITLTEPSFLEHLTATVKGITQSAKRRVSAAGRS